MSPPLKINKTPLYLQAQQLLLSLIDDGTYQPGERLPSEIDLAAQLGISRPTLREALLHLERQGVVSRRHGVGTFITSRTPILESGLQVLESVERQARRIGLNTKVVDLNIAERPATLKELAMLSLPSNKATDVLSVDRVIAVKDKSVAYLKDVIPQTYLRQEDLGDQFSGSVLDILLQRGTPLPTTSRTEIMAEEAKEQIAARLEISPGTALLKLVGQLYNHNDRVLDYSISYFVPGYFKFHVMRRVDRT
ncbi:MAG: GntR family transcriptional regulator [Chloroflexi bacterium]|nr:GntR family transcriptional regulator [Chloroflexota bacterium]